MVRTAAVVLTVFAVSLAACTSDDAPESDEVEVTDGVPDPQTGEEPEAQPDEGPRLDLVDEGTLTVCSEAGYPPFGYVDDDGPLGYGGFDIELIAAVADAAGLGPVTIVEAGFEDIASGVAMADGRCDVGASAISISESRAERVDFTAPYYTARQSLLARVGSGIDELDDLTNGMVLGVQQDTAAADRAAEHAGGAEIRTFEDGDELFASFEQGELDAVLHDLAVNRWLAQDDDDAEVVERYERVEEYGFALAPERGDDLLQVLDDGLQQVRDEGTYDELSERFFTPSD